MTGSSADKINWKGVEASAAAAASASLSLTAQLLGFLIRKGRLTKAEAAEIMGAARAACKMAGQSGPGADAGDDWTAQADALLSVVQKDVIR
jgi:hypothetical protein